MTIPRDLLIFTAIALTLAVAPAFATVQPEPEPPVVDPEPTPQPTGPKKPKTDAKVNPVKERKDYVPRMRHHCPEPKKSSLITDQTYRVDKYDIAPAGRCCVRAYSWREAKKICEGRK